MVHMCKVMKYPGQFFHIFQNFDFSGCYVGGRGGLKGQQIAQNEKKRKQQKNNYICHMPYLSNSTGYDLDFWYTHDISRGFFNFFFNFDFLGC